VSNSGILEMAEIERRFDGEWVLMDEVEIDESGWVTAGRLLAHSSDRDEIDRVARDHAAQEVAVYFIGEPEVEGSIVLGARER
jgi:hypothetical protein